MKRQLFFSFHYKNDCWRAAQVRNIVQIDKNSTFCDNDWEEVREKDDSHIKKWIDEQLQKRSCLVVLIGENTANRKWINYEIKKAYELNKGIVGIYIHKLSDKQGKKSEKGENPFDYVYLPNGEKISKYIKCMDPVNDGFLSVYLSIKYNIDNLIEYGLENRPLTWGIK